MFNSVNANLWIILIFVGLDVGKTLSMHHWCPLMKKSCFTILLTTLRRESSPCWPGWPIINSLYPKSCFVPKIWAITSRNCQYHCFHGIFPGFSLPVNHKEINRSSTRQKWPYWCQKNCKLCSIALSKIETIQIARQGVGKIERRNRCNQYHCIRQFSKIW